MNFRLLIFFFCASCTVTSRYEIPCSPIPVEWKGEASQEGIVISEKWWEVFGDSELNRLVELALKQNQDLIAACMRVLQARALVLEAGADLYPQITFDPSTSNMESLLSFFGRRFKQTQYQIPVNGLYQVDLWGQIREQLRAAIDSAEAQQFAYEFIYLTTAADTASAYLQLRGDVSEIELLEETVTVRKEAFEVNRARYDAGLINYGDVSRAELLYSNAKADLSNIRQRQALHENQLAVLTGLPASEFCVLAKPLKEPPPTIATILPCAAIANRPDVARDERNMASLHAQMGVAWTAFFPSLTLNGTVGLSSPQADNLFTWQARLWAYGTNMAQVVFDGGFLVGQYRAAKAAYFEAIAQYEQTILNAIAEVEDALSNLSYRAEQARFLVESVRAAIDTKSVVSERYQRGLVNYLDVADAERSRLETERAAIIVLAERYLATVDLIRGLGGAWQEL